MDRSDSAFDESFRLEALKEKPAPIHRSNTAPSRQRKPKKNSSEQFPKSESPTSETHRPASEKPASGKRKSGEPRRKSLASSSDISTSKSRRRGHGSLPSSRRTSVTIVDPSRPARHYRIKSAQTCPTMSRDIDDVLALHFRSCNLFQNPAYHSAIPSPTISGYERGDADISFTQVRPIIAPQASADTIEPLSPKQSEETITAGEMANTTMHWTSPSTRKREYEKIDRANSGLKGFMKKVLPRCVSGPPPPKFYEKDRSDVGSVRRYRMDVSDDDEPDEKSSSILKVQSRRLERLPRQNSETKAKRWWCLSI